LVINRLACLGCNHERLEPEDRFNVRPKHASSEKDRERFQQEAMSNQRHDKVHVYTSGHSYGHTTRDKRCQCGCLVGISVLGRNAPLGMMPSQDLVCAHSVDRRSRVGNLWALRRMTGNAYMSWHVQWLLILGLVRA
jgi:hypothetical protein